MIHNHEVGGSIPPLATTSVLVKQWGKGRLSGLSFPCFLEGVLRGTLSIATRHAATNAREPAIGYSRVGGQLSPRPYQGRGSQSCRLVGMGFSAEKPGGFFITTRHAASLRSSRDWIARLKPLYQQEGKEPFKKDWPHTGLLPRSPFWNTAV